MKAARILCVEGYESLQIARRMILEHAGYDVHIAASFNEAITKAGEQAFDVAIICSSLADSEANRLAQNLRTISARTRIILLNSRLGSAPEGDSPEVLLAYIRATLNDGNPVPEMHRKCA
jgi:DNA-binding response OmpR family regulator